MRLTILILITNLIFSQNFPTIPKNVFRFSFTQNQSESNWDIKGQEFDLRGIGRRYFDHLIHNDSLRFSSDYDLYHNGSFRLNSTRSVEEWLNWFNSKFGKNLPVFESVPFDTSNRISVSGNFS